jgi:cardiolipin synthase
VSRERVEGERDDVRRLADALALGLRALQRAGVAEAVKLSPSDLRGNAHGLSCAILGTLWQKRRRAPPWDEVSRAWERALAAAGEGARASLSGRFDAEDRLALLTDNAQAFAVRARLHAGARRAIDLATYYLQGDATGLATVAELAAAAARGVRVRVLADAYIMAKKEYEGLGAMGAVAALRQAGVTVSLFRDPARPYDANHRKMLIVDGEHLVLGGRNLADHYAGSAWRDVELHLTGPTARRAEALFARTLAGAPEPPATPGEVLRATTPAALGAHDNFLYLLACVGEARRTVDLENAYILDHDAVLRALAAARRRGVRVRVLTNSAETNDLEFANHRLYLSLRRLFEAGAEIHLRRGAGRTLHCKYFVVDDAWVSVGTSNLDYYSPRSCTEVNVHAESPALASLLTAWFERGLADATPLGGAEEIAAGLAASRVGRVFDALLRDVQ